MNWLFKSLWCILCIYLLAHFVMWIFGWHTVLTVKVTFLIMCVGIIGVFVAPILDSELLFHEMWCTFLAGGASCAVFKWVSDPTWQIAIVCVIAFLLIRGGYKIYVYHTKPYIVGIGDHCEIVRNYPSRAAYDEAMIKERKYDQEHRRDESYDLWPD